MGSPFPLGLAAQHDSRDADRLAGRQQPECWNGQALVVPGQVAAASAASSAPMETAVAVVTGVAPSPGPGRWPGSSGEPVRVLR